MSESTKPTLAAILNQAISGALDDVRVALPGRIVAYNATKQRVDVQPLVKDAYEDEQGMRRTERVPVVTDVPVAFPGSGAYRITFPIRVGDSCMLLFASSSLARWKSAGTEVDPGDDRHHALPDAICIPGVTARPLTDAPTDAIVLHSAGEIRAGGDTPAALTSDLDTLKTAITNAVVVANDGGASFKSTLLAALTTWPTGAAKLRG